MGYTGNVFAGEGRCAEMCARELKGRGEMTVQADPPFKMMRVPIHNLAIDSGAGLK